MVLVWVLIVFSREVPEPVYTMEGLAPSVPTCLSQIKHLSLNNLLSVYRCQTAKRLHSYSYIQFCGFL